MKTIKTEDGIRYRITETRDRGLADAMWIWQSEDGRTLAVTDDELRELDDSKSIDD